MSPTAATRAATNTNPAAKRAAKADAITPAEEAKIEDANAARQAEAPAAETENQKRNRLRNEAERHILNLHKDEFADYAEVLFSKNGLTFNRRLTEAEKAERKVQELIAKHPELKEALLASLAVATPAVTEVEASVPQFDHSAVEDVVARVEAREAEVPTVVPAPQGVTYAADPYDAQRQADADVAPDYSNDPFAPQS